MHPYDGTLVAEPATDTGAMAPAGQVWATITDLATYAVFLGQGHPDVLSVEELDRAYGPQSGTPEDGVTSVHGLGFQVFAGGSGTLAGHTGSMPGFLATVLVDRKRRTGGVVLANATTGYSPAAIVIELLDELERCEPTLPEPWRPSAGVPAELAGVPGRLALGQHAVRLRDGGQPSWSRAATASAAYSLRGRATAGCVGVTGYHAGEELHVVRRADGSDRPPRRRDVHLHPDAVRPGRPHPRRASGSLSRASRPWTPW